MEAAGVTGRTEPPVKERREEARQTLGTNIRLLRKAQGRTLADVAAATGLSVSLLSQVERGLLDPSMDSLRDIADALGTEPFRLLMNGSSRSLVVRAGEGVRIPLGEGEVDIELLSPSLEGAFEVGRWWLPPGGASARAPRAHAGEEATLILEGEVVFELGSEVIELGPGDYVVYSAALPHRVRNAGPKPAAAVFVVSPPSF
jgi:transcriptional regulator with XRE-family HTH domain